MCSESVLSVSDVSKVYRIYRNPVDRMRELYSIRRRPYHEKFIALKNIDFEVFRGETVGIIGPNGSGKSTLLEIIAGTLSPTTGSVRKDGSVAALLELGAGFNPTFSGRENVYLNASLLGISKPQIEENFSDILSFADIGDFIDHPVSTYSSGMYVRLAFATAISTNPDILIVDEALAVGDIRFQRKCFRRFEEMQKIGKTILFVSHAVDLIQAHCSRALFLNQGQIREVGDPKFVIQAYLEHLFGTEKSTISENITVDNTNGNDSRSITETTRGSSTLPIGHGGPNDLCALKPTYNNNEYRWGDRRAEIFDYKLTTEQGDAPSHFQVGDKIQLIMRVVYHENLSDIIYGCTVKTVDGQVVFGANTRSRKMSVIERKRCDIASVRFSCTLDIIPGDYFISLGIAMDDPHRDNLAIDRRYDLIHLCVTGEYGDFGIADLKMKIEEIPEATQSAPGQQMDKFTSGETEVST